MADEEELLDSATIECEPTGDGNEVPGIFMMGFGTDLGKAFLFVNFQALCGITYARDHAFLYNMIHIFI